MYRKEGSLLCRGCNMIVTANSTKLCCRNAFLSAQHYTPKTFGNNYNGPVINYTTEPYNPNSPYSPKYNPNSPYSPKYNPNSPYASYSPKYNPNSPYASYSPKYNPNSPYSVEENNQGATGEDEPMEID